MRQSTHLPATHADRTAARPRRRRPQPRSDSGDVGRAERALALAGGGLLAAYGLRKRGLSGAAMALAGAALVGRGATGRGATGRGRRHDMLGRRASRERGRRWLVQQHGPSAVLDAHRSERATYSLVIARPRSELYAFWRELENLPEILPHIVSVRELRNGRSRWVAQGPAGRRVRWDAVITHEVENELIGWKSLPGADVPNAGSVHFSDAPHGRGTLVQVIVQYTVPGGAVGAAAARLFGQDPGSRIAQDLLRLKADMEGAAARR